MSDFYVGRWHSPEGNVIAVIERGRSNIYVVYADTPVRLRTMTKAHERHITPIDYPLSKAARKLLAFGRQVDITRGAKDLLQRAQVAGRLPPV